MPPFPLQPRTTRRLDIHIGRYVRTISSPRESYLGRVSVFATEKLILSMRNRYSTSITRLLGIPQWFARCVLQALFGMPRASIRFELAGPSVTWPSIHSTIAIVILSQIPQSWSACCVMVFCNPVLADLYICIHIPFFLISVSLSLTALKASSNDSFPTATT